MSSDAIKDFLIQTFPGTSAAQWKRRSKGKVAEGALRVFENTVTGDRVDTIEASDGVISIRGSVQSGEPGRADAKPLKTAAEPVRLYDPELAAKVTETGKKALAAILEANPGIVQSDTDSISPPVATGPADRNHMVPGSKWVFDADVTVTTWEPTAALNAMLYDRSINYDVREARAMAMAKAGTAYAEKVLAVVPKGTVIEVVGKLTNSSQSVSGKRPYEKNSGLMVPVSTTPNIQGLATVYVKYDRKPGMPFSQIRDHITPLSVPETLVYVLRDSHTGEYFGGWETEDYISRGYNHGPRVTDRPKMVKKFSSAKKYKTNSAVKASIRDFTGYNSGINDEGEEINYIFADGQKKMDLPPTWEMVAVDKPTGVEKEILDVQNWYKDLLRLRTLTQNCGPAVRAVFKKGEGQGFGAIVLFQNRSRGVGFQGRAYDEASPFEDERDGGKAVLAHIKELTDAMSGKTLRVKGQSSVAVACSMADGMAAHMGLTHPDLDSKLYDFNTLEEIVANPS